MTGSDVTVPDVTVPDRSATTGSAPRADPLDAVLLLSFGGPERGEDVMPFLENVTRGRGIPRARLEEVAEHYHHMGGRSPINDQNRALLAALRAELDRRGLVDLPLYWGNRNWQPYLVDSLRAAYEDGARRIAVLVTSAYSSYSGCRQYQEDIAAARAALGERGRQLTVHKIRNYGNHPGFLAPAVDATLAGWRQLPEPARARGRLLFVTHSLPTAMNDRSGPDGGAYVAQHRLVAGLVADAVGRTCGRVLEWDLVYCSRSGPPHQPWLEPDINDHLRTVAAQGVSGVVAVPIGFVSDHMEVGYDLDTQARLTAADLDLPFVRAATAGTDPRFVAALVDLVLERAAAERGEVPPRPTVAGSAPGPDVCPAGCCPSPRAERPAAGGPGAASDEPGPAGRGTLR